MKPTTSILFVGFLFLALAGMVPAQAAVDEAAAQSLAKRNDCFKCHAIDKTKDPKELSNLAQWILSR